MTWLLLLVGCGGAPEPEPVAQPPEVVPTTARMETHRAMVEDLATPRHPSDGGGRAWLEEGPTSVEAGATGHWELVYEAGPLGIADGGALVFQVSPFWGWDTPQAEAEDGPGYTVVSTDAEGVRLVPETVDQQMMRIGIAGRALAAGERVRVRYGAGPLGARADRFAESAAELWFAVDGDGDGVRELIVEPVTVDVVAGPARRLHLVLPTTARPGDEVRLRVAAVDAVGNRADLEAEVALEGAAKLGLPGSVVLEDGVAEVRWRPSVEGIFAVQGRAGELLGDSNPMLVAPGARRVLWGDLQIHTGRSDGTGTPAEVWAYAREVAGLDVAAITDHDHWGLRFLDQHPELWEAEVAAAKAAGRPGEFVAIPGFEWTSWKYGHRHVLWFEEPQLFSSLAEGTDTPEGLWAALDGKRAFTVAHHSAGGPVAVDWSHRPPPELEPVTEIVSVHGQSEAGGTPVAVRNAVAGNFVVDQLRKGMRFGLIGSTDGHDGHPGLAQWNGPSGGLVGIFAEERTPEAVYEALKSRRVYATNGIRALVVFDVDGQPMGSELRPEGDALALELRVLAPAPVVRVDEVRMGGERQLEIEPGGLVLRHQWALPRPDSEDFVYVRITTADGGMAWSSPVWIEAP